MMLSNNTSLLTRICQLQCLHSCFVLDGMGGGYNDIHLVGGRMGSSASESLHCLSSIEAADYDVSVVDLDYCVEGLNRRL